MAGHCPVNKKKARNFPNAGTLAFAPFRYHFSRASRLRAGKSFKKREPCVEGALGRRGAKSHLGISLPTAGQHQPGQVGLATAQLAG